MRISRITRKAKSSTSILEFLEIVDFFEILHPHLTYREIAFLPLLPYTPRAMRRTAFLLVMFGFLCACNLLQSSVTYNLTFDVENDAIEEELVWSSLRRVEDIAKQLEAPLLDKEVLTESGSNAIALKVENAATIEELTAQLSEPFTLQFMSAVPAGQGDVEVEGQGSFKDTGVGAKDVFWAESASDDASGQGAVRLLFTKEGFDRLSSMLKQHTNEEIGLFVQGKLVSKLKADQVKENVVIRGIPSPEMASHFADLVNVGLHVTFTPAP